MGFVTCIAGGGVWHIMRKKFTKKIDVAQFGQAPVQNKQFRPELGLFLYESSQALHDLEWPFVVYFDQR